MPPFGEVTPQVDILSPKSRCRGGVPHRWYGGVHLDAPGQRRGQLPSSVWTRHRAVKQGQSGGTAGTTSQGKGTVSREVRIGQGGRGRAQGGGRPKGTTADEGEGFKGRAAVSGERPMGAASCRQQHNHVSCQPPPPKKKQAPLPSSCGPRRSPLPPPPPLHSVTPSPHTHPPWDRNSTSE